MKILLLGATGQVGWELARTLPTLGELYTTQRNVVADDERAFQLDTGDLAELLALLERLQPTVVVNATAYTAVDKAESEPGLAMRLNADVPEVLGRWAAQNGALVVHYSTDYVYDGRKAEPYVETDTPNPLGVYGRTKLAGDEALLASGCRALILRVSWVYGRRSHNFLLTMQRLMRERDSLRIVDDQFGAPTWCRSIAEASARLLAQSAVQSGPDAPGGVFHLAPSGHTSWFGFATAIRDRLELDCVLEPIPTSEYPTPAMRPSNSRLDCSRLAQTFGIALPSWDAELGRCLATD